jgi:hypothetical protein
VTFLDGAYFSGSVASNLALFESWRGKPLDLGLTFMPKANWLQIEDSTGSFTNGFAKPTLAVAPVVVITVPMLPDSGATLAGGAGGAYNSHFVALATRLIAAGLGSAYIRLGHEMNGNWYTWSAINDHANYIAMFQQVVTAMRAVSGANFKFNWNPTIGGGGGSTDATPEGAYPGDAYVDQIGVDVYDLEYGHPEVTPAQRWTYLLTNSRGLNYWKAFADAHSKPLTLPEWGVVPAVSMGNGGGGDDPTFISNIFTFARTQMDGGWLSYFNSNPVGLHSQIMVVSGGVGVDSSEYPLSAVRYKQETQNVVVTPPDNPPPPPPVLVVGGSQAQPYYG